MKDRRESFFRAFDGALAPKARLRGAAYII